MSEKIIMKVPYFQVPNAIYDVTDLSLYEKAVYIYLCRCGNHGAEAFPSYKTIALKTGMSKRKAIYAVDVLKAKGYLRKVVRKTSETENDTNLYEVYYPGNDEVVHDIHQPSAQDAPPLVHDMHHPSVHGAPNKEPIKKNQLNNIYIPYLEVIEYLNTKVGTNYKHTTAKNQEVIKARFNEGFTLEDFKTVIDIKASEWKGTEYQQYLRPITLFGTKFESYLNQKPKEAPKTGGAGFNFEGL